MEWLTENAKDGTLLLLIPAGEFIAGGTHTNEGGAPCPVRLPLQPRPGQPVPRCRFPVCQDDGGWRLKKQGARSVEPEC